VGKIEALKDIGVHSNRVPIFENPNRSVQARGLLGPYGGERLLAEGSGRHAELDKAMMIVEMTKIEQL